MALIAKIRFVIESSKVYEDTTFTRDNLDKALYYTNIEFVETFERMFGQGNPGVVVKVEHEHTVEEV